MSKRVLVIDDEKNIRLTLKHTLEAAGYEVDLAINGEDGLQKLKQDGQYAAILVDMKMPGISGLEFLERAGEYSGSPVVMITAYGTVETAVQAMKLGAVDFLSKPFSPESIRKLVDDIARRQEIKVEDVRSYETAIAYAKRCINEKQFAEAKQYLQKAISYDATKPEVFNLMGAMFEIEGKIDKARKQYRAALALDPAYKPAEDNLHRVTQFKYTRGGMNLGEPEDREEK